MPKKLNYTFENIETLFKKNGTDYTRKEDEEFVEALKKIFPWTNQNDIPFTKTDIRNKTKKLKDFTFVGKKQFHYVCDLSAKAINLKPDTKNWDNERIFAQWGKDNKHKVKFKKYIGVAYLITCVLDPILKPSYPASEPDEYIIKFGSTRTPFGKRLASYNCGTINNSRTASTTNFKLLQSFVACNTPFKLYLCFCGAPKKIRWLGKFSIPFSSAKPLAVEDIMIKEYIKEFRSKPLANIQTNATEVNE